MAPEGRKSVEQIKQEIEFYKEILKFINSFYLPLITGFIVLIVSDNSMKASTKTGWFFVGSFAMGFLTMLKRNLLKTIHSLIKEL
jgi:hypothetical protein